MNKAKHGIWEILERQRGVISYDSCPRHLVSTLRRMAAAGGLTSVLPGIFAPPERADEPVIRMRAAGLRDPTVVFTDLTAAFLLWNVPHRGSVCATGRISSNRPHFHFSRGSVLPEWTTLRKGFRCTNPALTAIDLIPTQGGRFVDRVLRDAFGRGAAALDGMWAAFHAHPGRPGNVLRRKVLTESRDRPWSEAERQVHGQLRNAGITGWRTNFEVVACSGRRYFLDIAFPELRIAVEVDGFSAHSSPASFEVDRVRQNDLVLDGWLVVRVTWRMIQEATWLHWVEQAFSAARWPTVLTQKGKR